MPPIYDFDVATNKAPSTLDALEPDEILGRIQNRQEVAEQEYNELIRQSKLPTDRYSPSQAFGASALAILPALAAYAFGGDDKYAYGAMGAAAGGKGAAQYLAEVQSRNKLENEIAGLGAVEASKKLDDLRSLETVATQSGINAGSYKEKYDLALRNKLVETNLKGKQVEAPSDLERQSLTSMLSPLGTTPEEIEWVMLGNTEKDRFYRAGELRRAKEAGGGKQRAATVQGLGPGFEVTPGTALSTPEIAELRTTIESQDRTLAGIDKMKDVIKRRGVYASMLAAGTPEEKRKLGEDLTNVKLALLDIKTGIAAGNPMFKGVLSNQDVQRLDALAPRDLALMENGELINFLAQTSDSMLGQLDALATRIQENQARALLMRNVKRVGGKGEPEDKVAKIRSLLGRK